MLVRKFIRSYGVTTTSIEGGIPQTSQCLHRHQRSSKNCQVFAMATVLAEQFLAPRIQVTAVTLLLHGVQVLLEQIPQVVRQFILAKQAQLSPVMVAV